MNRSAILLAVLGAVLLGALWWLFLYSPGNDQLATLEDEIQAAQAERASLEQRVAALELVRARAAETEAALARVESLLPVDPALPGAFRQIEAAADDAGVVVRALAAERPEVLDEGLDLYAIEFTINVEGSYFQLVDFARRIEDPAITSRAIEFTSLAVTSGEYPTLTSAISGRMFARLDPVPTPPAEGSGAADAPPAEENEEAAA